MTQLDGDQDIVIKVTEVTDEPGKPIYLRFEDKPYQLLLDQRCLGMEADICGSCKLRFRCHSSDALYINVDNDLVGLRTPTEKPRLSEVLDLFLQSRGVDLTKTRAYAKILEDREAKIDSSG